MLKVENEIGKLKRVLVHPPGKELLNLTPSTLEELLFDDIPYLKKAQEEHEIFRGILEDHSVETFCLEELMAETLEQNPGLKDLFLDQYLKESSITAPHYRELVLEYFNAFKDPKELVLKTMEGISSKELEICKTSCLVDVVNRDTQMIINPMPNLYFTRDPFSVIGKGVSINKMHSATRSRETIYGDYIIKHHEDFKDTKLYYGRDDLFSIEGGDIFNFSEKIIGIGISQRTTPEAIQDIGMRLFYDFDTKVEKIIAFNIPSLRAFMHLDTVFTQIDKNAFLYHPGIMSSLRVFVLTKSSVSSRELKIWEETGKLSDILSCHLELGNVKLFPCAGGDYITSQREQWNDGSNTLAIAPKTLVVYDRNEATNEMLKEEGYTLLEMPSSELSRGRGGPRCMSMPLERENV
ncbi:MAG: arginine deiminase [Gallicola sp.]|nr:arginine deiminase [Gallicola sp.]